ncbi:MAG: Mg2+/Co2+ transporter CorB [Gammaproteobacteria bacterium]
MIDVPIGVLVTVLIVLIVLSAFFSSSETGMMALNRYRLRHLVKHKHKGALRASRLLERPDRLIGVILLGNNFVNILASSITTVIALRLYGESGIAIAAFVLTMVILIFAEVTPKTLAVLYPERVAFPASIILIALLRVMYPLVAIINWFANGLLRIVGVATSNVDEQQISQDELRTVVNEASSMISRRFKRMLISILDLERVTVDDIMIPRGEINAIDLDDERNEIEEQITHGRNTRLPVYRGDINNVQGILHMRKLLPLIRREGFDVNILPSLCDEPYFVPEGTPLDVQLRNFQRHQQRLGLVVDEYGDVQGLVTLEDLLEEIVGDFTSDPAPMSTDVHPQADGTFLVDAASNIRDLNRSHGFQLPADGPKTLNGLIIEHLESIPETGTTVLINNYPLEVVQKTDSAVKTVRIAPRLNRG